MQLLFKETGTKCQPAQRNIQDKQSLAGKVICDWTASLLPWQSRRVCVCARTCGGVFMIELQGWKGHDVNEDQLPTCHKPIHLFSFFQCDIRLFEVDTIYTVIHDSLLPPPTHLYLLVLNGAISQEVCIHHLNDAPSKNILLQEYHIFEQAAHSWLSAPLWGRTLKNASEVSFGASLINSRLISCQASVWLETQNNTGQRIFP